MEKFSGITKKPSTCTHFKKKQIKHNVIKKISFRLHHEEFTARCHLDLGLIYNHYNAF